VVSIATNVVSVATNVVSVATNVVSVATNVYENPFESMPPCIPTLFYWPLGLYGP
jgi:hypothetical protein